MSNTVVIATRNQGKVKEFAGWFRSRGVEVRSLADYTGLPEIVEDGETFADNARIKAETVARHLGIPVLADDSGLEVEALDRAPGVRSARYAGEDATDADNNAKLLRELAHKARPVRLQGEEKGGGLADGQAQDLAQGEGQGHPEVLSPARFVCAMVFYDPLQEKAVHAEGSCEGWIIGAARGAGGFGYDPLFYLPEYRKTMAELGLEEKNKISHRAKAVQRLVQLLQLP